MENAGKKGLKGKQKAGKKTKASDKLLLGKKPTGSAPGAQKSKFLTQKQKSQQMRKDARFRNAELKRVNRERVLRRKEEIEAKKRAGEQKEKLGESSETLRYAILREFVAKLLSQKPQAAASSSSSKGG
eukprot:CAMPEP_0115146546 /NCGR_PEP_ID=MMETSP0227-20121206/62773_1 /TAXON_ID=89957 /ORGANISM="Polarella glacialis, Strain CCMP 1383" /LENGTH=128 /DNA_ID=CAMNT_0002556271 /DNA_START=21 /DNA_END=403 /DNA_ORIENTATION=-